MQPDWMNKINTGDDATTFSEELNPRHFKFTDAPHADGAPYVIMRGQVKRADAKGVMVQVPKVLLDRMDKSCIGATSSTLTALAEWALDQLEEKNATLTIDNK
jgi:hypothetical protein